LPATPHGQASVELGLVFPLLVLFVMVIVQFGMVAHQQLALWQVAREAARAASVSMQPQIAADAVLDAIAPRGTTVVVSRDDGVTTVLVTYVDSTDLALLGFVIPDVTLRARVSMASEVSMAGEVDEISSNVEPCNSLPSLTSTTTCS